MKLSVIVSVGRFWFTVPNPGILLWGISTSQIKGMIMAEKLGPGTAFPEMTLDLVGGGSITLPGDLDGKYAFVVFYRGHW